MGGGWGSNIAALASWVLLLSWHAVGTQVGVEWVRGWGDTLASLSAWARAAGLGGWG